MQCNNYWLVTYRDGRVFPEYGVDGHARSWGDAPHEGVEELLFMDMQAGLLVKVEVPEGAEPVLFRRHRIEVDPTSGGEIGHTMIPCVGWRKDGEEHYRFALAGEAPGQWLETSDFQAV